MSVHSSHNFSGASSSKPSALAPGLLLKSLALVVFLLLLQCGLFLFQIHNVQESEKEARRQEAAQQVIATAHNLMQCLYDAGDGVTKFALYHDPRSITRYEKARDEIPHLFESVRKTIGDQPRQLVLLGQIETQVNKGLGRIAEFREQINGRTAEEAFRLNIDHQARMQSLLEGLVRDFMEFLEEEKKIESRSPLILKDRRDEMRMLTLCGNGATLLGALLMILFLLINITSRLSVALENSGRLLARRPLEEPLSGGDEVAALDQSFHEMAEALAEEEARIQESESELREIIEELPVGLMILSAGRAAGEPVIDYANPAMESLLDVGAESDPNSGKHLTGRKASEFIPELPQHVLRASAVERVTLDAVTATESALKVEVSAVPIKLDSSTRILTIVNDVTARHELDEMKKSFVAMVSHDLRTPLTSVAGFLQLLPAGVYGPIEERTAREASQAEVRTEYLITLINDLLDLEKLNAGHLEMHKSDANLEDCICDAIDAQYSLAEELGVAVEFEGSRLQINADADRLSQSFGKILNAFLRQVRSRRIAVQVAELAAGRIGVRFYAAGILFPGADRATFFEPFQSMDSQGGFAAGLGLALSRQLIRAHGGEVKLLVEKDSTSVIVDLPA